MRVVYMLMKFLKCKSYSCDIKTLDLGIAPRWVYDQWGKPNALGVTKWGLDNEVYLHLILLYQCQDLSVGAFVHFDAEVDEDDVADAANVWIHHSRHG